MKNNTIRKIMALVLVWCLTIGGIPTVAFSDGTDAAVISTPAPEPTTTASVVSRIIDGSPLLGYCAP